MPYRRPVSAALTGGLPVAARGTAESPAPDSTGTILFLGTVADPRA
ncbi:hypothetical protein [Jiangella rhizosphaerae]|nr:hypothetical protein [Jiangella rhizosphaerae]